MTLLLVIPLTVACGTNNAATDSGASQQPASSEPTRSIEHAMGTVQIPVEPKRVVAIEWSSVEDVLALGVTPIGVADIEGFKKWVNIKHEIPADVVDVGSRVEPNIETIASLKPDLIIATDRVKAFADKLNSIAPTIVFYSSSPEKTGPNSYEIMEKNFRMVADALNKKEEGEKVLKEVNDSFAQAGEKLKAAGKVDHDFALIAGFSSDKAPVLRFYAEHSMAAQVLQRMGMKNAFQAEKYIPSGIVELGVEALPSVQQANFFYVVQDDDNIFATQLKDHPVWKNLAFNKENRTYPLGGDTWLMGGPLSAQVIGERVVASMMP